MTVNHTMTTYYRKKNNPAAIISRCLLGIDDLLWDAIGDVIHNHDMPAVAATLGVRVSTAVELLFKPGDPS